MTDDLRVSTLSNGMTVVTETYPLLETASVGVWVPIGSRHEQAHENGISHFLEHMAFRGTQRRTSQQIAQEIETVGGYLNAYTSKEATAYYARVLADDVPLALDLLGDILQNSTFDAASFDKERTVILQEIARIQDNPDDLIYESLQQVAYPHQSMGRPISGTASVVSTLTPGSVRGYMDRHYGASSMVLAASGKIDHDQIVAQGERILGSFRRDSDTSADKTRYEGGVIRTAKKLGQSHVMIGFEGPHLTHDDYYAAVILSSILGGGMSSRLYQEIREKRGLAYAVNSFFSAQRDTGMLSFYGGTADEDLASLLPIMAEQMMKVAVHVADDELTRAKNQCKAALFMGLESAPARCRQLAQQMIIHGAPMSSATIIDRINHVSTTDIMDLSRKMTTGRPTIAVLGDVSTLDAYSDRDLEKMFMG